MFNFFKTNDNLHKKRTNPIYSHELTNIWHNHKKTASDTDEVIKVLVQNKWLRYALIAALMLAAISGRL